MRPSQSQHMSRRGRAAAILAVALLTVSACATPPDRPAATTTFDPPVVGQSVHGGAPATATPTSSHTDPPASGPAAGISSSTPAVPGSTGQQGNTAGTEPLVGTGSIARPEQQSTGGTATGTPGQAPPTDPAKVGAPTNIVSVTAQQDGTILGYRLSAIDFHSPAQVAWGFVTSLFNYSYRDPGPAAGSGRAARFAVPKLAATLTKAAATGKAHPGAQWKDMADNQIRMDATVTTMNGYLPNKPVKGSFAIIEMTVESTLTQAQHSQIANTQTLSITVTRQPDGTWLVSDTGNTGVN